ncbi:serine hydrolase domain-containing protein [Ascidiimonas sp. W6]|uniref:serine hydrolase domain-containing protein n=1 Tax=Ascidiimonas meishanensis TaxID=3128903 RepID=UPI0030ECFCE6
MRFVKSFFKWLLILIALFVAALYIFDYDYILKAARTIYGQGHKTAYLDDYKVFDTRIIKKSSNPQSWSLHKDYNNATSTEILNKLHVKNGTVAFLIIKNDSIWFEEYREDYTKDSKSNSFSMAKSIVSALLGKAIKDGYIKSVDQPLTDFYPEFTSDFAKKVTVGDLATMSSGLDWDEAYYSPFSVTTRAYFEDELDKIMLNLKIIEEPGKEFKYLSGSTQLLGMLIGKASGKTLAEYLSEGFWQPMGAENDAVWQLDSKENGLEKAYCCIGSNARDFARMGKLYKDLGNWKGKQILDTAFVKMSVTPRFKETPAYGYSWWLPFHLDRQFFMMRGHLGQYVIVQPEDNMIIVRLGHRRTEYYRPKTNFTDDIYIYIEEAYKMTGLYD